MPEITKVKLLAEAKVWRNEKIEDKDVAVGPSPDSTQMLTSVDKAKEKNVNIPVDVLQRIGFSGGFYIQCDFVTPSLKEKLGGKTQKFECKDKKTQKVIKVKYDPGHSQGSVAKFEQYAEVSASRLFWLLGFGADRMYSINVQCFGCPKEPWTYINDVYDNNDALPM